MLLISRFNNTFWIHNVVKYCSINSCSMLTKNNSCYNVVGTRADNSWWKKLVDRCQQWLNNGCWTWTTMNNGCWQQLLTGRSTTLFTVCSTTLQQVVDNIDQVVHFCACTRVQFRLSFKITSCKIPHQPVWSLYKISCFWNQCWEFEA